MFKILAGDYGNPPKSETWLFGQFIITPSDEVELSNFNCKNGADDQIFIDKDITKIQILKEEDFGKDKKGAALWALGGAVLAGPLGLAGGLLAGNKKEVVILIETRVGNKFIAKADEKSYRKILNQSNYCPEAEQEDSGSEVKASEGNDLVQELEKLGALKEKGLLTNEEFATAKAKLLS